MRSLWLLLLVSMCARQGPDKPPAEKASLPNTGESLYRACQASTRYFESTVQNEADYPSAMYCLGYFEGFADTADAAKGLCLSHLRIKTVIHLYLDYMDKEPTLLKESKFIGVVESLQSYRCPEVKPKDE